MDEITLGEGFGCEMGSMATPTCSPMDSSWNQLQPTYQSTLYWAPSATVQTTHGKSLAYKHEIVGDCRIFPNTPSSIGWDELGSTDHLGLQDLCNEGNDIHDVYEKTNNSVSRFDIDCSNPERGPCTTKTNCSPRRLTTENEFRALMHNSQDRLNRIVTLQRPSRTDESDICAGEDIQRSNAGERRHHNRGFAHQEQQHHAQRGQAQEKNRSASAKYRMRQRDYAMKIISEEQDIKKTNRELSSCVANLSLEVYELKRKLLLHSDCNHPSIQRYIWNEAQRFVQAVCEHSQTETS